MGRDRQEASQLGVLRQENTRREGNQDREDNYNVD